MAGLPVDFLTARKALRIAGWVLTAYPLLLYAQISPGELSKAHEALEGISNCTQCHESGQEIRGTKCLECHAEIRISIGRKQGFHFENSSTACIECHKEHLGKDARITRFDPSLFDHSKTGFHLDGKHQSLRCEQCHTNSLVRRPEVRTLMQKLKRSTYLGLETRCNACHQDRHKGTLGNDCQTCHSTNAWAPASKFSHDKTRFPLTGKHGAIPCEQCHAELKAQPKVFVFASLPSGDCTPCHRSPHGSRFTGRACSTCHTTAGWLVVAKFDHAVTRFALTGKHIGVECSACHPGMRDRTRKPATMTTKGFDDCQPCHTSPHSAKLTALRCASCHTAEGWRLASSRAFDHALTKFPLRGNHAAVPCERCHGDPKVKTFVQRMALKSDRCVDCHEDYHRGEFSTRFGNDCAKCHTERSFKESTFSIVQHRTARFALDGSHVAVSCDKCHNQTGRWTFHAEERNCQTCHEDRHRGTFVRQMGERSCAACHSTQDWTNVRFDHSGTAFSLKGKHETVACSGCHKEELVDGVRQRQYKGTAKNCDGCHEDHHAQQFAVSGSTRCETCHVPGGWNALLFRHESMSTFSLTGAHRNVPCAGCHKREQIGSLVTVRYKPLSTRCESCHQGGK